MQRKLPLLALVSILALAAGGLTGGPVRAATPEDAVRGQYIIVLKNSVADPETTADELARLHGLGVSQKYTRALKGFAATIPAARLASLQADPRVQSIAADSAIHLAGQSIPTGVLRIGAAPSVTRSNTGQGINVAVLDTGIDLTHPDLKANLAGGKNCLKGGKSSYGDTNGHGTHVAGIIAALNNKTGVVGVAPGARLWSVRVLDSQGNGTLSSLLCGIDYVTSMAPANGGPIQVANLSLDGAGADDGNCGYSNNDPLHQAICRSVQAGVTYVAAAGNEADDAAHHVPAAYDEVITVSAFADTEGAPGGLAYPPSCLPSEQDDTFASFSNYGADVDLAAPGVCIASTWIGGVYRTLSGTSMAAPHVSGAAALYLAAHPGSTPAQVRLGLLAAQEPGPLPADPDGGGEGVVRVSGY